MEDIFTIANKNFKSRLIVGTGKYKSFEDKNGQNAEAKYLITKINYNQLQQLFKGDPDKLIRLK